MANFIFESGNLALDLVNTRPLSQGERVDQLQAPDAAGEWLLAAGVMDRTTFESLGTRVAEHVLADLRALRDAIADAAAAFVGGSAIPAGALVVINEVLSTRRYMHRVVSGTNRIERVEVAEASGSSGLVAPVAEAAADLLSTADPARVRQCDDAACVLWFIDSTRNGSRRWCSMTRCGNRAKTAAHYRRRKQERLL